MQKVPFTARGTKGSGVVTVTFDGRETSAHPGVAADAFTAEARDYYWTVAPNGEETVAGVLVVTATRGE